MKPLTATFTFILFTISLSAQIVPVKNAFQTEIAKVVKDYSNGFKKYFRGTGFELPANNGI